MAKLDPIPLVETLVLQLADAADDQFEFAALLTKAKMKLHEAHMAQVAQNSERLAGIVLAERATIAGVTVEALKAELAAELGKTAAAASAAELVDVVKTPAPQKP